MRRLLPIVLALAATFAASAQTSDHKATGSVWLETFAGPDGAVIYPQYAWTIPTAAGKFGGYGFVQSAPHERVFNNNLVNFTPKAAQWFTAHGEIGDVMFHRKGFVQLGPRANIQKMIPKLDKILPNLFIAYLPAFAGIRTNNVLVAGATLQFPVVSKHFGVHLEAFNRTFADFSYGEAWLIGHVNGWKRIQPIVHVIRDSSRHPKYTVSAGLRFNIL